MWLRDVRAVTFDDWFTLRHLLGTRDLPRAVEEILTAQGVARFEGSFRDAWTLSQDEKEEAQWAELREEPLEAILRRLLPEPSARMQEVVAAAIESLAGAIEWFPDALPTLDWLRAEGYRTALVSNTPVPLGASWQTRMAPWFDAIVLSREVGHVKPHEAMFRDALRRLGVLPSMVLHVGDQLVADVFGAKALGMRAALLVRGESAPDSPRPADWLRRAHGLRPEDIKPDLRFRTLEELPAAIEAFA